MSPESKEEELEEVDELSRVIRHEAGVCGKNPAGLLQEVADAIREENQALRLGDGDVARTNGTRCAMGLGCSVSSSVANLPAVLNWSFIVFPAGAILISLPAIG
jgi:hypothetical protein